MVSYNNRLILEPYKNEGQLKSTIQHGIAMVSQKISVKGLTVLADARLSDGSWIYKGSKAFIREELLHTQPWAKKLFESSAIDGQFMIVDLSQVDFVESPKES